MARQQTVLDAFLSSPSDQTEERQLIADVIAEQNKIWSDAHHVRLNLLRWETDVVPGLADSPQDRINEEIGDQYDVFIGVLGARFGSATDRAGSGTEEEFQRALERCRNSGRPHLLMYFSAKAVALGEIDPEQLALVKAFRAKVGDAGVLFAEFRSTEELEKLVRLHLGKLVSRWTVQETTQVPAPENREQEEVKEEVEEELELAELGLFDFLETAFDKGAEFEEVMARMTSATVEIGERIRRRTAQIEEVGEVRDRQSFMQAKAAVLGAATDLNMFTKRVENETPLFASSYSDLVESYTEMLQVLRESPQIEDEEPVTNESIQQISGMLEAIRESSGAVVGFQATLKEWPPISGNLNRAKRRAIEALSGLIDEFSTAENLTVELLKSFESYADSGSDVDGT